MQFLSHLRISHKISALMVGLVLGFIAIGVTYYVQIDVDNEIRNVERETFDFQNRITELNLKQLQMQAATRQYLNSGDSTALERRERLSTELRGEIQAITGEFSSGNQVVELSERLAAHEEFFQAARKNLSTYGSARAGSASWRSELTQVSEDLETALRSANDAQLMARFAALQEEIDGLATRGSVNRIAYESSWARLMQALDAVSMSDAEAERARNLLERYQDVISATNEGLAAARSLDDRLDAIELGISRAFADVLAASSAAATSVLDESADGKKLVQAIVTAIIFLVAMGTAIGVYLLYKSIVFPMAHMQSVIRRINQGRSTSRVKLLGGDELGDLGRAFNQLLDERIQQLEVQSLENERLNNSIISLIKSLGMIAKRDLTIKVPVSADITGTVSDAVNLLTTETAKTLHQVKEISDEVNGVSDQLQAQSSRVIEFAEGGKKQVVAASKALELLAQAMNEVAQRAEQTRETADEAIVNTRSARQSVENTVEGIRTIRETIAETEKRTKRLGDRSQEISGIVSLINSIAERTHILALNASMHAASAGEAGKGFAVVADEVQRLAESARQSTEDIAAMVTNMRVETADTVTIMNTLIAQVAEGSRKAEQAGRDMGVTEAATRRLVENVEYIAQQAIQQADIANRVRDRSALIRNYTEKTGQQLLEQKIQTDRLKACAHTLVERINVFTLPEALRDQSSGRTATQKALPAAGELQAAI